MPTPYATTGETMHDNVLRCWNIYRASAPKRKGAKRRAYMANVVANAIKQAAEWQTKHLHRDYRGWDKTTGAITGPGSGRSAHWLDICFEHYRVVCHQVHEDMPQYRDGTIRTIARTLARLAGGEGWEAYPAVNAALDALPPCTVTPTYWDDGYAEEFTRGMASGDPCRGVVTSPNAKLWRLYYQWHIKRAVAEYDYAMLLQRLERDPAYTISGYLAASILAYQG
jgi:hypothetical protein